MVTIKITGLKQGTIKKAIVRKAVKKAVVRRVVKRAVVRRAVKRKIVRKAIIRKPQKGFKGIIARRQKLIKSRRLAKKQAKKYR